MRDRGDAVAHQQARHGRPHALQAEVVADGVEHGVVRAPDGVLEAHAVRAQPDASAGLRRRRRVVGSGVVWVELVVARVGTGMAVTADGVRSAQRPSDGLDRDLRRHLAVTVAAHAVGDHVQTVVTVDAERVFVVQPG